MVNGKWKHLAQIADILTIIGFIPILIGILYWLVKKMDKTLFLEICLVAMFMAALGYSIGYRISEWRKKYKEYFDSMGKKIQDNIENIEKQIQDNAEKIEENIQGNVNKIEKEISKWREILAGEISGWSEATVNKYKELELSINLLILKDTDFEERVNHIVDQRIIKEKQEAVLEDQRRARKLAGIEEPDKWPKKDE